jgi:hypothetical protein
MKELDEKNIKDIIVNKNFSSTNIKKLKKYLEKKMRQYFNKYRSFPLFNECINDGVNDTLLSVLEGKYDENKSGINTYCYNITRNRMMLEEKILSRFSFENYIENTKYYEKIIDKKTINIEDFLKKYKIELEERDIEIFKNLLIPIKERKKIVNREKFNKERINLIYKLKKQTKNFNEQTKECFYDDLKKLIL